MRAGDVDLHIEELMLQGFAPDNQYCVAEAVEQELVWLLAERGVEPLLTQGGGAAHFDGGMFDMAPGSNAKVIGGQVARALYDGLKR
jgi:hypothetical protein